MRTIRENKWIRYENGKFIGEPQTNKGTTGNWIVAVHLNWPGPGQTKLSKLKDETYDVCYLKYHK